MVVIHEELVSSHYVFVHVPDSDQILAQSSNGNDVDDVPRKSQVCFFCDPSKSWTDHSWFDESSDARLRTRSVVKIENPIDRTEESGPDNKQLVCEDNAY